ncbi:hypothetical protein D3C78_1928640 [compost metagenome]
MFSNTTSNGASPEVTEGIKSATGSGKTVTITVPVPMHPEEEIPVTVYVVVVDGEAVTVEPFGVFKPLDGDQL